jgi:hypothetical protein
MNLIELQRALGQLRLGGMAAGLETRLRQAQAETMAPIDLISCLISDELTRRSDRLLDRRRKQAGFRDANVTLDNFDSVQRQVMLSADRWLAQPVVGPVSGPRLNVPHST